MAWKGDVSFMDRVTFSIVVVCLNAGKKLKNTIESILEQTYENYEIIIKDGLSGDDSLRGLPADERIHIYREKDRGIYDAMNQATSKVNGEFVYFLNCGDLFFDKEVLYRANQEMVSHLEEARNCIFYGDIFERRTEKRVSSNPHIDAFACYRNVPCHQACFYSTDLMRQKSFDTGYRVRADYEHFLWCFFKAKAKMQYLPFLIADYEGGGFSETEENRKRSAGEHLEITQKYMNKKQLRKYRMVMLLTLAPLRSWAAGNRVTAGLYNRFKQTVYRCTKRKQARDDVSK